MNSKMKSICIPLLILTVLATGGNLMVRAEKAPDSARNAALFIGNSGYQFAKQLKNPGNDTAAIAKRFSDGGWDVTVIKDADNREIRRALREFCGASRSPTQSLIYYAGHGIEHFLNGVPENFLLPVDARIETEDDLTIEAVRVSDMLDQVKTAKLGLTTIVLDCCRNAPFEKPRSWQNTRSASTGGIGKIAAEGWPPGSMIVFSTAPGKTAADGRGNFSPFAEQFLTQLKGGVCILDVFIETSARLPVQQPFFRIEENSATIAAFRKLCFFDQLAPVERDNLVIQEAEGDAVSRASGIFEDARKEYYQQPLDHCQKVLIMLDSAERELAGVTTHSDQNSKEVIYLSGRISNLRGNAQKNLKQNPQAIQSFQAAEKAFDQLLTGAGADDDIADWKLRAIGNSEYCFPPESEVKSETRKRRMAELAILIKRWPKSSVLIGHNLEIQVDQIISSDLPASEQTSNLENLLARLPPDLEWSSGFGLSVSSLYSHLIRLYGLSNNSTEVVSTVKKYLAEYRRGKASEFAGLWPSTKAVEILRYIQDRDIDLWFNESRNLIRMIEQPRNAFEGVATIQLLEFFSERAFSDGFEEEGTEAALLCIEYGAPLENERPIFVYINTNVNASRRRLINHFCKVGRDNEASSLLADYVENVCRTYDIKKPAWIDDRSVTPDEKRSKLDGWMGDRGDKMEKKMKIDCRVGDVLYPITFYFVSGGNGYEYFQEQVRFLKEKRGIAIPEKDAEIMKSLHETSRKTDRDFIDLVVESYN